MPLSVGRCYEKQSRRYAEESPLEQHHSVLIYKLMMQQHLGAYLSKVIE